MGEFTQKDGVNMCNDCEWQTFLEQIEEMLNMDEYQFAENTLNGIADWVEENEHITDSQQETIENIWNSKQ